MLPSRRALDVGFGLLRARASAPKNVAPIHTDRFECYVAISQLKYRCAITRTLRREAFTEKLAQRRASPPLGNGWKSIQQKSKPQVSQCSGFPTAHRTPPSWSAGFV
ncbi:hypothetical protein CNECB9_4580005 [Cupriavidus necator]|uniref:Uncharacterized protein n=1 Tax=Cupriavidus necator TaxID=106590 RepID=A0A1K0JKA7_CUPNE|nr:hypothetical protein CNECB9_4580005 [Cupriavidus necator]